jgi:hypothetical protein
MISIREYRSLTQDVQAHLLWLDGVNLDMVNHTALVDIELYSLYDFYVEIVYDHETEEPIFLNPFKQVKKLDPYLKMISIEPLLEIRGDGYAL